MAPLVHTDDEPVARIHLLNDEEVWLEIGKKLYNEASNSRGCFGAPESAVAPFREALIHDPR